MTNATDFIKNNLGAIGAGVGGLVIGGTVATIAARRSNNKKSRKRKATSNKNRRKRNYSNKKQRQPYTARKHKDTSHIRIRYTSKNQPYIILRSGKARFIKKSSVRTSRKRKGGRY